MKSSRPIPAHRAAFAGSQSLTILKMVPLRWLRLPNSSKHRPIGESSRFCSPPTRPPGCRRRQAAAAFAGYVAQRSRQIDESSLKPLRRSLAAVEALARWTHPRLGSIPPDRFIELAESRGMIIPLGLKLMGIAVRQAAAWRSRFPGKCPTIHVNISPLQFAGSDVIADFLDLLEQHDLPPSDFCIEVTESAFTNADAVRALRLGFKVTMDDFGIGYSALSQLPRLPLVSIKLDRSFISQAADSPDDAAMLTAIVQLAHALKLKVIAEGVERADQFDLVAEFGCDGVQEFFFSRPMAPGQFDAWLSGETPLSVEPQTV
jgi:EAL domain-containing protein (putative c-di-GMP-specific phosphodiesterase class I)